MKRLMLILATLLIATCMVGALADAAPVLPNAVPAQSKEDFIGEWQLSGASILGSIYFTAEELDSTASLVVGENSITINFGDDSGTSPWVLLEDGTLQYTDPDGSTGVFVLNDDGTVSTTMDTQVQDTMIALTMYFARVPEQ